MSLGLRTKLLLLFGLLTVISLANYAILRQIERRAAHQQAWLVHTHEVIAQSLAFWGHMRDAETGQRGFLLTQDEAYLEPYHIGVANSESDLRELKRLTEHSQVQQERLEAIHILMQKKVVELEQTVRLAEQSRLGEAMLIVNSDLGQRLMDELRQKILVFNREEEQQLIRQEAEVERDQRIMRMMFVTEGVVLISLIMLIAVYIQKTIMTPISLITKKTRKLAQGQIVEDIPYSNEDELGELVAAFNHMQKEVRNRTDEVLSEVKFQEAFSRVVTACTSGNDFAGQLNEALQLNAQFNPCPLSALYFCDEASGQLKCVAAHGTSAELPNTVGSGLIWQCYQSQQCLLVETDSIKGFFIETGLAHIKPRTIVLQPVSHGDDTLGIFVLAYTSLPNTRDRQYIESLAVQFASLAVNAQQYSTLQQLTSELELSHQTLIQERDKAVKTSLTDALTGLQNRECLRTSLLPQVAAALRYGHDVSLMMIDVDHFKQVNDSYGHQTGDQVLIAIAEVLTRNTRTCDSVSRYGGEEFIIVLPQTHIERARITAEKLRLSVEALRLSTLENRPVTISIGVSMLMEEESSESHEHLMDMLIDQADKALYQAKRGGRNQVALMVLDTRS